MYRVIEKLKTEESERWLLRSGEFARLGSSKTIALFETEFDAHWAATRAPNARRRAVVVVQKRLPNGEWV